MGKIFESVSNLFDSEKVVTLNERGSKYLRDITQADRDATDDYVPYDAAKIDDRGNIFRKSELKGERSDRYGRMKVQAERYLYDVIKHLAPAGYDLAIDGRAGHYTVKLINKGDKDKSFTLCNLEIYVDENDKVVAKTTEDSWSKRNKGNDIFAQVQSMTEIGQELARKKGVKYDEEFMIDNGAEIKELYYERKEQAGKHTYDGLVSDIEKQINKLPDKGLLSLAGTTGIPATESEELTEAFSESTPNWLKNAMRANNKSRDWDLYSDFSNELEFETIDSSKRLKEKAREAAKNNEILFARTKKGIFVLKDRRWRSLTDSSYTLSTEDVIDNFITGVVTTNRNATLDTMRKTAKGREEARQGSVERRPEMYRDGYTSSYDKSGYRLDPEKYTRMLKTLRAERLASSETIQNLKKEDFVNRYNELGKRARQVIADNIQTDYVDGSRYSSKGFNTNIVGSIEKTAENAENAIRTLMDKVEIVKSGDVNDWNGPKGTDIEAYIKSAINEVNARLDDYENLLNTYNKSEVAVESENLKEGIQNSIFIDADQIEAMANKYLASEGLNATIKDRGDGKKMLFIDGEDEDYKKLVAVLDSLKSE